MIKIRIFAACLTVLILLASVCAQSSDIGKTAQSNDLMIEYIANEGISISYGGKRILIDAVHRVYKPEYESTPVDILTKIENSRYPYNDIRLILVSHYHLDHFQADSILNHLVHNREAVVITSNQVADEIDKALANPESGGQQQSLNEGQLQRVNFEWQKSSEVEIDGIKVRFLGFLHANSKLKAYRDIQNFGHLFEFGGKKFLHIGDADMFAGNFEAFALDKENIDVAFVPYWYLMSEEGRSILKKNIKAKTVVAIHVPPGGETINTRDLLDSFPSAVVFSEPGEMLNY